MPPKRSVSERIRQRLREELHALKISQRSLAERLTRSTGETWLQPRVGKVLLGHIELKVDDLEAIASVCGLSLVSLVREPGRELVADLTPSELMAVESMREQPQLAIAITALLAATKTPRKASHAIIKARMALQDSEDD